MRKILAALLAAFVLACAPAYADDPKNCAYTTGSGKKIPVVCSQPVKIHEILNQPRERVESILGPGVNADKMGIMVGDGVAYQGGGIVVFYYDEDLSQTIRISTDFFVNNTLMDVKNVQAFFSTETLPQIDAIGCEADYYKICADGSEPPLIIAVEGWSEFSAYTNYSNIFLTCP